MYESILQGKFNAQYAPDLAKPSITNADFFSGRYESLNRQF